MDYQSQILAAIDVLHRHCQWPTSDLIAIQMRQHGFPKQGRVARTLCAMAKAGLVVYDRKDGGWRKA